MKKLSVVWTRHLKDESKKEEFEKTIRASTTMAYRLLDILKEEEDALDAKSCSIADFDNPNWALKQAFIMGEKSRIKKLRDLLEHIKGN